MKKLLGIVVLGLLLSGCVQNFSDFNDKSWELRESIIKNRDVQINLFEGDELNIYLATFADWDEKYQNYAYKVNPSNPIANPLNVVAKKQCKRIFNSDNPIKVEIYEPSKKVIKERKFYYKKYTKFKCEDPKPEYVEKESKSSSTKVSNNTLNRSFVCNYKGEKSKIKIRGNTATETTAIGVIINYSIVSLSSNGAFTLEGSSKQGRAWFIGAQSFLLLDTNMIPYNCN